MPTNVLLAPVGAGKTEIALTRMVRAVSDRPLARVWVLLATKRQEDGFRQRLAEWDASRTVYFNVEFFNFYNHPSWGAPNNSLGSSAYNTINSQSVQPRQLQLGLKYLF